MLIAPHLLFTPPEILEIKNTKNKNKTKKRSIIPHYLNTRMKKGEYTQVQTFKLDSLKKDYKLEAKSSFVKYVK